MIKHHRAFTADWFRANLTRLCWAFNAPLLGRWLRRGLALRPDGKVTDIRPDSVVIEFEPDRFEYNGWTGDVVSQYVYEIAKPLWWAIHYWDEWIADRWIPQLSYGFDTLTTYTQTASASTRAFDVFIQATAGSFSQARSKSALSPELATFAIYENTDPPTDNQAECSRDSSLPLAVQNLIARTFLHFDTSPLAGTNRQNVPGTVTVDSAYVVCVEGLTAVQNPSTLPMGLYLTQSTIDPSRTSTTIVGSDFRQTPLTTFAIGESPLQLPIQYPVGTLRLVPGSTVNPRFYWWVFQSAALPEIESYYYPANPPGSVGAHNGLARFCLKQTIDFNNNPPSGNYAGIETIVSRDRAASIYGATSNGITRNVLHAPRLNVVYTVGRIVDAFSLVNQTQFGLPEIQAPREVRVNGFREYATESARFFLPTIPDRSLQVEVRALVNPAVQFGNVLIPVIFVRSLVNTSSIGSPSVVSPVTPTGIASTLTIFSTTVIRDTGRGVFPRGINNGLNIDGTTRQIFGVPFIEGAGREVRPRGIAPTVQFGARWYIGQAFPESVYISRLIDQPIQFQQVMHEYEDGRVDVNLQVCGVRSWRIEYEGISEAEVGILVQHFREVKGRVGRFPFYHRRDNVVYEDCYYTSFDIPARVKKWANNVSITIERQE
jgi:hypothetical protein